MSFVRRVFVPLLFSSNVQWFEIQQLRRLRGGHGCHSPPWPSPGARIQQLRRLRGGHGCLSPPWPPPGAEIQPLGRLRGGYGCHSPPWPPPEAGTKQMKPKSNQRTATQPTSPHSIQPTNYNPTNNPQFNPSDDQQITNTGHKKRPGIHARPSTMPLRFSFRSRTYPHTPSERRRCHAQARASQGACRAARLPGRSC